MVEDDESLDAGEGQVSHVRAERTRQACVEVPRASFLDAEGRNVPWVAGRSIPPTSVVVRLMNGLELDPGSRVLVVGNGSGYIAAVASRLAADVFAIERMGSLCDIARTRFDELGFRNIHVREGDGSQGWEGRAPFDAILVAVSELPDLEALRRQLAIGGRMVFLKGARRRRQSLGRAIRVSRDEYVDETIGEVEFVSELQEVLEEMGLVDADALDEARRSASESGEDFNVELQRVAQLSDNDIYRGIARQRNLRLANADTLLGEVDMRLFERMPRAFLDHHRILPVCIEDETVRVATSNPDAPIGDLEKVYPGYVIDLCLVTPTDFRRLWTTIDLWSHEGTRPAEPPAPSLGSSQDVTVGHSNIEARAVAQFEAILLEAIGARASDFHAERYGERVRLRLRIDGELIDLERYRLTVSEMLALVNIIKVRSDIDIAEKRLPQGGRFRIRAGGEAYDLRVQTQPCLHGEHVVVRLLPQSIELLSIEDLGFPSGMADQYRRVLQNPAGLALVVGPTGSGKSTTLYAGLQVLAKETTRKVITVEDPIEYAIEGIQQTRVRPKIGFSFADAMRSFVRQDPDVILVGEIRDAETALEALRASQTGHVVLSTLHCNDAVDAVQRLYDLGMHPNSVASELMCIVAQRLAKRVCPACKEEVEPDPRILAEVFPDGAPHGFRAFRGRGCERCGGRGTKGRVGVVEFLQVGAAFRGAISRQPPVDELRQIALDSGLLTMRDSAIDHVSTGLIPLEELPRILPQERMSPEARV